MTDVNGSCQPICKKAFLYTSIYFFTFFVLYFPYIATMVKDWGENDNYSHGYFIPVISGYLLYNMRDNLQKIKISPANWGLIFIVLGLLQAIVAKIGSEYFLQRTSMIMVLFGSAIYLLGTKFTKRIWFPLCYLLFMIPIPAIIWNNIAFPMQLFASTITEQVVRFFGISIFRQGNVLHLAQTTLEVVDACSGLRSLVTMFALSALLAHVSKGPAFKKWLLFLAAVPIAILINIIRLTFTAGLAQKFGEKVAQGFLHDFSGWLIFFWGLLLLIAVKKYLDTGGTKNGST